MRMPAKICRVQYDISFTAHFTGASPSGQNYYPPRKALGKYEIQSHTSKHIAADTQVIYVPFKAITADEIKVSCRELSKQPV